MWSGGLVGIKLFNNFFGFCFIKGYFFFIKDVVKNKICEMRSNYRWVMCG